MDDKANRFNGAWERYCAGGKDLEKLKRIQRGHESPKIYLGSLIEEFADFLKFDLRSSVYDIFGPFHEVVLFSGDGVVCGAEVVRKDKAVVAKVGKGAIEHYALNVRPWDQEEQKRFVKHFTHENRMHLLEMVRRALDGTSPAEWP